jgi:hypothetical protein
MSGEDGVRLDTGRERRAAFLLVLWLCAMHGVAAAQEGGVVTGRAVEAGTERPLGGVRVEVEGRPEGALTDTLGRYRIPLPAGTYVLRAQGLNHAPLARADVVVRPGRATVVGFALTPSALVLDAIAVRPSHFAAAREGPVARIGFSAEEIRRAPGSAGDVSRILYGLPFVAKVNDQSNGLAVRGGTPTENLILVDGIAVPNINHFAQQGASGGAIGLLNVELIREVEFEAGGFGAQHGNRMSSVLEITLRDGDPDRRSGQLSVDLTGIGAVAEGPAGASGNWVSSVRRSYLDLLVQAVDVGASVAPRYGDYAFRLATSATSRHRFGLLALWADDRFDTDLDQALEHGMSAYGDLSLLQGTTGASWTTLWRNGLLSRTSIAHTYGRFDEDYTDTASRQQLFVNRSTEQDVTLRHSTRAQLTGGTLLTVGGDAAWQVGSFDNVYRRHVNATGDTIPELLLAVSTSAGRGGVFATVTHPLARWLSTTVGLRADHSSLTGTSTVAPRVSALLVLSDRTRVSVAAGAYHQSLPLVILARDAHRSLRDPVAYHLTGGVATELGDATRLTVEAYRKEYRRMAMDPADPAGMPLDEVVQGGRFFTVRDRLVDTGEARASGVEATLQKKLTGRVHALLSGAWTMSEYRGLDGEWRPRTFDNGLILSGEGGWRVDPRWELSARWIYAGGTPYTPLDADASRAMNRTVLDRTRVAGERYPAYHSLNVRADRRITFRSSSMVAYLSVWNAYNRGNVASYYWHTEEQTVVPSYQWRVLPVFGVEWSF